MNHHVPPKNKKLATSISPLSDVTKHLQISLEMGGTWCHPANYNHAPRVASQAVLKYVETGTATITVGENILQVGPGDLLFLPRLVPVHYRVGGGDPFLHHVINFTIENDAGVHLEHLGLLPFCAHVGSIKDIVAVFKHFQKQIRNPHPSAYFDCVAMLFSLLSRFCLSGQNRSPERGLPITKAYQALHIIEEHYNEHLTIEEIARQLNITPEYLSSVFRKTFGITPKTQIRNFRLQRAGDMLWTTDLSVKEISFAVGYSSVNTFDRAFRKLYGESPSDCRQRHHANTPSGPLMDYRPAPQKPTR